MRRGFSPTSAFGALLVGAGAVLLCSRLAQSQSPQLPISWWLTLALELGVYAALLALFDVPKSLIAYPVGALLLAAVRWGIMLASAGIVTASSGTDLWQEAKAMDGLLIPRLAAMAFAVIAVLPLRDVLQVQRGEAQPPTLRQEREASDSEATLLFGSGSLTAGAGLGTAVQDEDGDGPAAGILDNSVEETVEIEGSMLLPCEVALKNVPAERLNGQIEPGTQIEVPLRLIVPQLKEARVLIDMEELAAQLPLGLLDRDGPAVELPLNEVVSRLPAEVLQRPKATPPAWAQVDVQVEESLFTAV